MILRRSRNGRGRILLSVDLSIASFVITIFGLSGLFLYEVDSWGEELFWGGGEGVEEAVGLDYLVVLVIFQFCLVVRI